MNDIEELQKILSSISSQKLFSITCGFEFEPHGRASEDWEIVWRLKMPTIPHHWRNNKGMWTKGTTDSPIEFMGKKLKEVVSEALIFAKAYCDVNKDLSTR